MKAQLKTERSSDERAASPDALRMASVTAGYGRSIAVRNVDIVVPAGSIVALLGPNGAGKTTMLRVAAGLVTPERGTVDVTGQDVSKDAPHKRAQKGLCLIPEGRGIFRGLTVRENLQIQVRGASTAGAVDTAVELFPSLGRRINHQAGKMSGGEQQMLALCRAFLSNPSVVMLDEMSLGLAPLIVEEIFDALTVLAQRGMALLLVEQYVTRALEMADSVYMLSRGEVVFSGPASEMTASAAYESYMGSVPLP